MSGIPSGAVWVRFPRFIGDSIMIHRALEPLRALNLPLIAWGPEQVLELFQGTPYYAGTSADPPQKTSAWQMSRLLRAHAPKAVVNLARSQRANLASWLGRVPLRIGWREGMGILFCNRTRPFRSLSGHQQAKYAALLHSAFPGLPQTRFEPFLPRASAQAEADDLLGKAEAPFVVFALGAMSWSKRLGLEVWIGLGRKLQARGWSLVLLGATGEDQERARVIAQALGPVYDLTGRTSLAVGAGVIRRSLGVVGNDSAFCHLAAACGVPTVAAFGPTDPEMTAPLGNRVRVVRREDLACLGCQKGACPVSGHPCMKGMPVADLLKALDEVSLIPS